MQNLTYGPVYATSSKGDIKVWSAQIEETHVATRITYTYGLEAGKKQVQQVYIDEGKNIGRSNETTHFEQAVKVVESKLNAKRDKGYGDDRNNIETPILPMLALPFSKRKHNIKYPAYVQPKIDGVRMTCRLVKGKVEMFTRKGKPFAVMPHIEEKLHSILIGMGEDFYLDGELFSETLTFQEVAGAVRRIKNFTDPLVLEQLSYMIFDCFSTKETEIPFGKRLNTLKTLMKVKNRESDTIVQLIVTHEVTSEDGVYMLYDEYMRNGAEGIMIRNNEGHYKLNHRSADLQKYKQFQDSEYKIIDFTEGSNNEKGAVVWVCETKDEKIFNVRPKGTIEGRKILFELGDKNIGKMLTVRYQELTDDGIPRFPVGISIRDYE